LSDSCGGFLNCSCPNPTDVCTSKIVGVQGTCKACSRLTCSSDVYAGKCGRALDNGCAGTMDCRCPDVTDSCTSNSTAGVAGSCSACIRRTCFSSYLGKCGTKLHDGCTGTIDCGCTGTDVCTTNEPNKQGTCQPCVPKTCANYPSNSPPFASCGWGLSDGCGGTINCSCPNSFDTCSVREKGTLGLCRNCLPLSCASPDYAGRCGVALNNSCGGTLNCICPNQFDRCSAGGVAGAIGTCQACVPKQCSELIQPPNSCGMALDNGCGGTRDCGCASESDTCTYSMIGMPGVCTCFPKTCASLDFRACGELLDDGCGGTFSCSCSDGPFACNVTNAPNVVGTCRCVPLNCSSSIYTGRCGVGLTDGCPAMGTISCSCTKPGETCSTKEFGALGTCQ
jgi:hypothetical protein